MFGLHADLLAFGDGRALIGTWPGLMLRRWWLATRDGWNANGGLANEFNMLPFNDFSIVGVNGRLECV